MQGSRAVHGAEDVTLLAAGSSILFGLAHGIQGIGGIVVTGILGLALAGVFVISDSLIIATVAHYIVNVSEFLVHGGLIDWAESRD